MASHDDLVGLGIVTEPEETQESEESGETQESEGAGTSS